MKDTGIKDLKVLFSVPQTWFETPDFSIKSFPKRDNFPGSSKLIKLTESILGKFNKSGVFLKRLIKYFRSFTVKPLRPYNRLKPVYEVIMNQKRGVCRHRALLFFAITRAYGFNTRLVFNKIHAFCEILLPNKEVWVRVDLGGATLPPDLIIPNGDKEPVYKSPNNNKKLKYDYSISGPSSPNSNRISISINHKNILPPFLWLKLIDIKGNYIYREPVFPKSLDLRQKLEIKIPRLAPGKYKLILESPDKL